MKHGSLGAGAFVLVAVLVTIPVSLLIAASISDAALFPQAATGPVYTVLQVRDGLACNPSAWVGRTVRVRASITRMAVGLGVAPNNGGTGQPPNLLDLPPGTYARIVLGPDGPVRDGSLAYYPDARLVVSPRVPDVFLTMLHHLPLVGGFIHVPYLGYAPANLARPRVFVLYLPSKSKGVCTHGPCQDALLFDADN